MIEINELLHSIGDIPLLREIITSSVVLAIVITVVIILLMTLILKAKGSAGKFMLVGVISTTIIGCGLGIHNNLNRYISERESKENEDVEELSELINPELPNKVGAEEKVEIPVHTVQPDASKWDFMIEESNQSAPELESLIPTLPSSVLI